MKSAIIISFALVICIYNCNGSNYYVSTNGLDSNPGTSELPFLTVQKGVNTAIAGDRIFVNEGIYLQDVNTAHNGSSGSPIILDGQNVSTLRSINIQNQYIYLINITIAGKTNWFNSLIYMNRGAHHCIISNDVIDGNYTTNVYPMTWNGPSTVPFGDDAASDVLVISNTFKRGLACPMVSVYGDYNVVYGNRLIDGDVVDWFRLWGRSNHIAANLCSNNIASGSENHPDFIQTFGLGGIGSRWNIIESNTVIANYGYVQICMMESQGETEIGDWTFRNNLFIGVPLKGTIIPPNVSFYNNIFIKCSTNSDGGGHVLYFGTVGSDSSHNSHVINNIFLDCGDSRTNVGWYYFQTNLTNVSADYNYVGKLGYNPVALDSLHRAIGDPGGWDYLCMVWWEPHGINGGNPMLLNESESNLHLGQNSPLIGAATNLNSLFTTDFEGFTRGDSWDIGPLEFNGPYQIMKISGKATFKGKATIR